MRSHRDPEDLTTRARIRDAAIELIGTRGFEAASLRAIAQTAGVSPALIVHHFGDKNGLRAACDAHVTAMFTNEDGQTEDAAFTIESLRAALGAPDAYGPALDYLVRMLSEDSETADRIFDRILHGTQNMTRAQESAGVIRAQADPDGTALVLTLFGLAPLLLRRQFARALGEERLTPAVAARITLPTLELFTHGLYSDDSLLRAAADMMRQDTAHPAPADTGSTS